MNTKVRSSRLPTGPTSMRTRSPSAPSSTGLFRAQGRSSATQAGTAEVVSFTVQQTQLLPSCHAPSSERASCSPGCVRDGPEGQLALAVPLRRCSRWRLKQDACTPRGAACAAGKLDGLPGSQAAPWQQIRRVQTCRQAIEMRHTRSAHLSWGPQTAAPRRCCPVAAGAAGRPPRQPAPGPGWPGCIRGQGSML